MSGASLADRRLHPATILLRMAKDLPSTALGLPAFLAFVADVGWEIVLPTAAGMIGVTILFNWLLWRRFRYGIGARDLVIESGLLSRNRRSIPFDRIQDVDIEHGPLHRLLGVAKVRIETGGSGRDEGVLDSVTAADADQLRRTIRAGKQAQAGAAEQAPETEEVRPVFALDMRRLLLLGLFRFSFLYLAGLFAILQAFEPWLPFDIYDPARWLGLVEGQVAGGIRAGAALFLLIVALLLGIVTGVVRTVMRDYRFRLLAEPGRFRRERGLFTRSEVVIAKPRIQLALHRTGPLRGRLGWGELMFQTLSGSAKDGGLQSVAPLAQDQEVAAVLGEEGRLHLPEPASLGMVSSGYIWRRLIAATALPIIVVIVATTLWRPALLLLLLLPLFAVAPFVQRRFHRYALLGDLLFVRRGMWRQRLWMVPIANVQAVSVSRSFLQRRLGVATLLVDTAGAPQFSDPRIVDLKLDAARALAAQLSGRKSGTER